MNVFKDGRFIRGIAMMWTAWWDSQINVYNVMMDTLSHKINAFWWVIGIVILQIRMELA